MKGLEQIPLSKDQEYKILEYQEAHLQKAGINISLLKVDVQKEEVIVKVEQLQVIKGQRYTSKELHQIGRKCFEHLPENWNAHIRPLDYKPNL